MQLLINLLINGFAVFVTDYFLPGIHLKDFFTAIIVSVILGIFNTILKPILSILTFPLTFLTLGLFRFVLNGLIILLVSAIVPGFTVNNIFWAIAFSLFLSLVNGIFNLLIK